MLTRSSRDFFELIVRPIVSFNELGGMGASSIGESRTSSSPYFEATASPEVMYWSTCGNVWLRERCEFELLAFGCSGREANCGTNDEGAVPESGVKNGDVGLSGAGENDEGAVSVKALWREFAL